MVAASIPWKKLENPDFNDFLNIYTNMKIPDESTLRKHYLHSTYLSTVEKIREDIGESYFWTSIDETTGICKKQFWKSSWSNHSFRGKGFASYERYEDNAGE